MHVHFVFLLHGVDCKVLTMCDALKTGSTPHNHGQQPGCSTRKPASIIVVSLPSRASYASSDFYTFPLPRCRGGGRVKDSRLETQMLVSESHFKYILTISSARWAKQSVQWLLHWFLSYQSPSRWRCLSGYLCVLLKVWRKIKVGNSEILGWLWIRW